MVNCIDRDIYVVVLKKLEVYSFKIFDCFLYNLIMLEYLKV